MEIAPAIAARYSRGAVILHWAIAVLIALNFVAALVAEDMPKAEAMQIMGNHKAIGIIILLLTLARIAWRLTHRPPPPSPDLATWEVALSKVVHVLLYVFMLSIPLGGWATHSAWSGGKPVSLFGLIDWPGLPIAQSKDLGETLGSAHGTFAWVMLGLLALHVAGALKHRFFDRNPDSFKRMWFGR